jgi:gas vesicle protein
MMQEQSQQGAFSRLNSFLDRFVLPYPVRYLTNRVVILITLGLLVPLIVLRDNQVFVLAANSYLNVMSVVVSSTVLLYSTLGEARDRQAASRREDIARQHEAMVEARAEADHELLQQIKTELVEHVNSRLDAIQRELMNTIQQTAEDDERRDQARHEAVMQSRADQHETLKKEIGDLIEQRMGR